MAVAFDTAAAAVMGVGGGNALTVTPINVGAASDIAARV